MTQKNLVALFAAGIIPLRKEVSILKTSVSLLHSVFNQVRMPVDKLDQFLTTLAAWNGPGYNSIQMEGARHVLASIVNKRTDGGFVPDPISSSPC